MKQRKMEGQQGAVGGHGKGGGRIGPGDLGALVQREAVGSWRTEEEREDEVLWERVGVEGGANHGRGWWEGRQTGAESGGLMCWRWEIEDGRR